MNNIKNTPSNVDLISRKLDCIDLLRSLSTVDQYEERGQRIEAMIKYINECEGYECIESVKDRVTYIPALLEDVLNAYTID